MFQSLLRGLNLGIFIFCWTELCWRKGANLVVTAEAVGTPAPILALCYGDGARYSALARGFITITRLMVILIAGLHGW